MGLKTEQERAEDIKAKLWDKGFTAKDIDIDTLVAQAYQAGADAMMEGVGEIDTSGIETDTDYGLCYGHNALVQKLKEKRSNI